MNSVALTIFNTAILLIVVACIIYLFVGAFLNARREMKGKPKKKRTSMIVISCALIGLCVAAFTIVSNQVVGKKDTYHLLYHYAVKDEWYFDDNNDFDNLASCQDKANSLNSADRSQSGMSLQEFAHYKSWKCGKNCDRNSPEPRRRCEEIY